jgi:hypothetical protein
MAPVPVARCTACFAVERDPGTASTLLAGYCQLNLNGRSPSEKLQCASTLTRRGSGAGTFGIVTSSTPLTWRALI